VMTIRATTERAWIQKLVTTMILVNVKTILSATTTVATTLPRATMILTRIVELWAFVSMKIAAGA